MKTKILSTFLALTIFIAPRPARADLWGADIPLLIEIVFNTLQQLITMKDMLENGEAQLELLREINAGINDSLDMIKTSFPEIDPGIYGDWGKLGPALEKLKSIYGRVEKSSNSEVETITDQGVAEAIVLNNDIYKYTKDIDQIAESIKKYSHDVSPGGAAKLTAQSMGVMLTVMNQSLRAQATGLKLQAQSLAVQNKASKEDSKLSLGNARALSGDLKSIKSTFSFPRFNGAISGTVEVSHGL